MPLLFNCRLMSTDWIWGNWDDDFVTNFPVTFLLCVSAGDFSRRLTSMWRRAAPPEWWPTRIYRSSPYQVKQVSIFSSGCYWSRYFMWKNLVSLLLFLSACKLPVDKYSKSGFTASTSQFTVSADCPWSDCRRSSAGAVWQLFSPLMSEHQPGSS